MSELHEQNVKQFINYITIYYNIILSYLLCVRTDLITQCYMVSA